MAGFPRTNGDFKRTLNFDTGVSENTGADTWIKGEVVESGYGPQLEFFFVRNNGTISNNEQIEAIIQLVQQYGTLHMYKIQTGPTVGIGDTPGTQLDFAMYPFDDESISIDESGGPGTIIYEITRTPAIGWDNVEWFRWAEFTSEPFVTPYSNTP